MIIQPRDCFSLNLNDMSKTCCALSYDSETASLSVNLGLIPFSSHTDTETAYRPYNSSDSKESYGLYND